MKQALARILRKQVQKLTGADTESASDDDIIDDQKLYLEGSYAKDTIE